MNLTHMLIWSSGSGTSLTKGETFVGWPDGVTYKNIQEVKRLIQDRYGFTADVIVENVITFDS